MHQDQAWPTRADFREGGGFYELTLRLRNALVWGGLVSVLAAVLVGGSVPQAPAQWLTVIFTSGMLSGLVAWAMTPSPRRLGHASRCLLEFSARPPSLGQPGNLLTERQERRDYWAFGLVLLLAWAGGPLENACFLALFSPLIVFRLCSRLWTEVDLVAGCVYYHRTFMGLQITRRGAELERAVGLVSGLRLNRPGEDPVYAVFAVMPDQDPLPLETMCATREESHQTGRRLSLQLNLLHDHVDYEPDLTSLRGDRNFRGRPRWKTLKLDTASQTVRASLPPVAQES